jgi:2-hydroxycyclohexanecarboxyl-CoA dehydrogenase
MIKSRRVALVTGGAAGMGRAISLRLARDGMAVGILGRTEETCRQVAAEIVAAGGQALALAADISKRTEVDRAVAELRKAFGPVTVLVNNAAIVDFVPFRQITDAQWDEMMEVNLKGTFIVTQVVLSDMEEARWGRIVNITSCGAELGSEMLVHYTTSKGGMVTFTRSLARELGHLGITVNTVMPGSIMETVMSEQWKDQFPIPVATLEQVNPVCRTGVPDDIADACAWVVGEGAGYITGQNIGVNGGRVMP